MYLGLGVWHDKVLDLSAYKGISIIRHDSLLADIGRMVNVAVYRVRCVWYDKRNYPLVNLAVFETGGLLDGGL